MSLKKMKTNNSNNNKKVKTYKVLQIQIYNKKLNKHYNRDLLLKIQKKLIK